MKRLNLFEILSSTVRAESKHGVYVSMGEIPDTLESTVTLDALRDKLQDLLGSKGERVFTNLTAHRLFTDLFINLQNLFLFDTEDEQQDFYQLFEGDVAELIYAMTINPAGDLCDENT